MDDRPIPDGAPAARHRAHDIDILARTLFGEARGERRTGQEAVAAVVLNRVARAERLGGYWWGRTVAEVCLKPWQFSCWNADDPNRERIATVAEGHPAFDQCRAIAAKAVDGRLDDPTSGATHYHALGLVPRWARDRTPCAIIGRHLFYNDVE